MKIPCTEFITSTLQLISAQQNTFDTKQPCDYNCNTYALCYCNRYPCSGPADTCLRSFSLGWHPQILGFFKALLHHSSTLWPLASRLRLLHLVFPGLHTLHSNASLEVIEALALATVAGARKVAVGHQGIDQCDTQNESQLPVCAEFAAPRRFKTYSLPLAVMVVVVDGMACAVVVVGGAHSA